MGGGGGHSALTCYNNVFGVIAFLQSTLYMKKVFQLNYMPNVDIYETISIEDNDQEFNNIHYNSIFDSTNLCENVIASEGPFNINMIIFVIYLLQYYLIALQVDTIPTIDPIHF